MKINQVEELVGITKKNIRFYEEKGLVEPARNIQNGYREYTLEDVDVLLKIKLLRKLSVPIDEIRKLLENKLTLQDCLQRHEIALRHEERMLDITKEMCREIAESGDSIANVDAQMYLTKMDSIERGGMSFVGNIKQDVKKKKAGPIIAAVAVIAVILAWASFIIWGNSVDPMPVGVMIILMAIPVVIILGVAIALKQRLKEIDGGEENEASKY
jgi:DNA-binding transcriptional MerR regulator